MYIGIPNMYNVIVNRQRISIIEPLLLYRNNVKYIFSPLDEF